MIDDQENMRSSNEIIDIYRSTQVSVISNRPSKNGGSTVRVKVGLDENIILTLFVGTTGLSRLFLIEDVQNNLFWSFNQFSKAVGFRDSDHVHVFEFHTQLIIVCVQNKKIVFAIPLQYFDSMINLWDKGIDETIDLKIALMRALNSDGYNFSYRLNNAEYAIVLERCQISDRTNIIKDYHETLSAISEEERDDWRSASWEDE